MAAVVPLTAVKFGRFFGRPATVVPVDQRNLLHATYGQALVFGYLHRTGPNIERKHDERFFFRWAPFNDSASKVSIDQRYQVFVAQRIPTDPIREPFVTVDATIVKTAEQAIADYRDRNARAARHAPAPPRPITPGHGFGDPPYPSDFVVANAPRCEIAEGDLFYALFEGETTVHGLYPVAIPRLAHEATRKELLHPDFHRCSSPDNLCAACRAFGWVRPGARRRFQQGRVDAFAGHIRFTHGRLKGAWGTGDRRATRHSLAILGSPKPTTTAFYLRPKPAFEEARSTRWPAVLSAGALSAKLPLYREAEASLRGRKFYRRREDVALTTDSRSGGILRRESDSQNQTVHLLPPQLEFDFRVFFDNLGREELGALLFATELKTPEHWRSAHRLRHAVGHGKPLGLGACDVVIDRLAIDVFDAKRADHRYARLPQFTGASSTHADTAGDGRPVIAEWLDAFGEAWSDVETQTPSLVRVRHTLCEMLRADPPLGAPIHYPPHPEKDTGENFEWFVRNRHPQGFGLQLPDPVEERNVEDRRLPIRLPDPKKRRR